MPVKRPETQPHLPGLSLKTKDGAHGGDITKGKRKSARPFNPKLALHVVLRSSRAQGELSMLRPRHCNRIKAFVGKLQKRHNIRVYRYANVGNHLHLLIRAKSRADWRAFIRELAGGVAMIVTGARKGNALKRSDAAESRGFWDDLVYTRLVAWGRDFSNVAAYVCKNLWESMGVPVRKILQRGYRCLEISEDGAVIVSERASAETLRYLARCVAAG
jgi:REP element-mobilizing transposase RayT